ncbi:hypothetical protein ATY30_02455 [Sinorhizobium americanum]|nr:hypothetical protein ATY30_02455 [Sinorhizobium americanum]
MVGKGGNRSGVEVAVLANCGRQNRVAHPLIGLAGERAGRMLSGRVYGENLRDVIPVTNSFACEGAARADAVGRIDLLGVAAIALGLSGARRGGLAAFTSRLSKLAFNDQHRF